MNRSSRGWTLALTSIAFIMVTLDALVVVTALPAIHREFGADLAQLEWTINAFTLTFAAGIITAAALGDRFGCVTPDEAVASHKLFAAALQSHQTKTVVNV